MLLQRTEKARIELQPGVRTLGLRERSLLLMVSGGKAMAELAPMFEGQGRQITLSLLEQGFLEPMPGLPPQAAPMAAARPSPGTEAPAARVPAAASTPAAPPPSSSDSFEGKRSMATTRMFLFDLCERMFVRRDPAMAGRFRDALREARDRASMLAVSREMVAEVERIAGHERADSISERIAMLMPPDDGT